MEKCNKITKNYFKKLVAACESTVLEVPFECSHHRVWCTDSKVRTSY